MAKTSDKALKFSNHARRILDIDGDVYFNQHQVTEISDRYSIPGAYILKNQHWRYIIRPHTSEDKVLVADPMKNEQYWMNVDDSLIFMSEAFRKNAGIDMPRNDTKSSRVNLMRKRVSLMRKSMIDGKYNPTIPVLDDWSIQKDGYNCGPLAVYLALVANKENSGIDTEKLKADMGTGIL
jgi:hypothetical protein